MIGLDQLLGFLDLSEVRLVSRSAFRGFDKSNEDSHAQDSTKEKNRNRSEPLSPTTSIARLPGQLGIAELEVRIRK